MYGDGPIFVYRYFLLFLYYFIIKGEEGTRTYDEKKNKLNKFYFYHHLRIYNYFNLAKIFKDVLLSYNEHVIRETRVYTYTHAIGDPPKILKHLFFTDFH